MSLPVAGSGFTWEQTSCGMVLQCRPLALVARHFFTSRTLGLTAPSHGKGDGWQRVAAAIGVAPECLVHLRQVHGGDVHVARSHVCGVPTPAADIAVTDEPGLAVAVRVADCVPVLLADTRRRAVAAVHAGWRGTAARAVMRAVEALRGHFEARPEDLVAAIGPCIGPCCYEVGEELADEFGARGHTAEDLASWLRPRGRRRLTLDLWRATVDQLRASGLREHRIHLAALCTATHVSHFHSFRAEGAGVGRMAGVIRAVP